MFLFLAFFPESSLSYLVVAHLTISGSLLIMAFSCLPFVMPALLFISCGPCLSTRH